MWPIPTPGWANFKTDSSTYWMRIIRPPIWKSLPFHTHSRFPVSEGKEWSPLNLWPFAAKLSILEAKLSQYIDTIQNITWEIQEGRKSKLNRKQVYQKTGRFYGLRHRLKMNSHLVSVPEFYWRRRELEELFLALRNHLKVSKRAEALKEKLVHCVQLMNLVQNNLDTLHHSRLEKMIIVLISIEVQNCWKKIFSIIKFFVCRSYFNFFIMLNVL